MHLLVTGVASSGKTSVARLLAVRLGAEYLEADAFHSPANVEKMTAGIPLTDADREPWLRAIGDEIAKHHAAGTSTVVACSALRRYYRDILRAPLPAGAAYVVQLRAPYEVLADRIAPRADHFMPPSLLHARAAR
jgi:gluconokinase